MATGIFRSSDGQSFDWGGGCGLAEDGGADAVDRVVGLTAHQTAYQNSQPNRDSWVSEVLLSYPPLIEEAHPAV